MVVFFPIQIIAAIFTGLSANAVLGVAVLFCIGSLAIASQSTGALLSFSVNTYNSGVGVWLNKLLVLPTVYLEMLYEPFILVWNGVTWFAGRLLILVFRILDENFSLIPELAGNIALLFTTIASATQQSMERLVTCWEYDSDNPNFDCIGNSLATSLDVMSPAVYMQGSIGNIMEIVSSSCNPFLLPLNVLTYPLLDVNLYMTLHGLVNFVWSAVYGTWNQRHQRCAYGAANSFSDGEKAVMCMPDFNTCLDWCKGAVLSLGRMVDNWLDMLLVIIERSYSYDHEALCQTSNSNLRVVWDSAVDMLASTQALQVVGLSADMYAITDGESAVYRSLVEGQKTYMAPLLWPFPIEPRYGVAAVQHSTIFDADYGGSGRTGMLGCACVDTASGVSITCASVPFQTAVDDTEEAYYVSSTHHVQFVDPLMTRHLTCATVQIKVSSLRFSRKRASVGTPDGYDTSARDRFDSLSEFGEKLELDTADAAIYVMPKCALQTTDPACVPETVSCFPFCMGLHVAGQSSVNITMYNQRRWAESVNIQQIDCLSEDLRPVAECQQQRPTTFSPYFGFEYAAPCDVVREECMPHQHIATSLPLSLLNTSTDSLLATQAQTQPYIRLEDQPFVMAGDIMLFQVTNADLSSEVVISRLYDNNRGDYTLNNEQITIFNTPVKIPLFMCDSQDDACYVDAVFSQGGLVAPYPDRLDPLVSHATAVSEWGVHWADNPDNSVLNNKIEWCAEGVVKTGIIVNSSYSRPRVWTLRTSRMSSSQILPGSSVEQEGPIATYMRIPNWLTLDTDCRQEVNMKIVDLEYLNPQNILVTVLRAAPEHYDVDTGTVCAGCPYKYAFYFMHPNMHKCLEPSEGDGDGYTCWHTEEEGMFTTQNTPDIASTSSLGALCPALRRMPQLGSVGGHVGAAGVEVLRGILDIALVIPVSLAKNTDIFKIRPDYVTYHPVLDSSGQKLFAVNTLLYHIDSAAFHFTNSFVRIAAFFENVPGYNKVEAVIVGTARVLQYSGDSVLVEGVVLAQLKATKKVPVTESFRGLGGGILAGSSGKLSALSTRVQATAAAFSSGFRYVMRFGSAAGMRLLRNVRQFRKSLRVLNVANFFPSLLAESSGDFRRSLTNNIRLQCDGFGNIFGTTNPIAKTIRHSCILLPDMMDSVIQTILILTMDYPAVSCGCKFTQDSTPAEVIESQCLTQSWAVSNRINLQEIRASNLDNAARQNMCFGIMDTVNRRFETAWDPFFSRLVRINTEMARSINYILVLMGLENSNCDDFSASPYILSIIPYPIDYFAGCAHTPDCRARCADEFLAFETALANVGQGDLAPNYKTTHGVHLESKYFSFDDIVDDLHLPPFEIFAVLELETSTCTVVCNNNHVKDKCVAITGLADDAVGNPVVGTAYYCIPADFATSLYSYFVDTTRPRPQGDIDDMFFLTTSRAVEQPSLPDATLVLVRDGQASRLVVITETGQLLTMFSTVDTAYDEPSTRVGDLHTIEDIWVLPAAGGRTLVSVYMTGYQYTVQESDQTLQCVRMQFPIDFSRPDLIAGGLTLNPCEASALALDTHLPICLKAACTQVVRVPVVQGELMPVYYSSFDDNTGTFIECSIDNCIGCQSNPPTVMFSDLQSKCYTAQECSVSQCVGSTVNLRKPLCNLGKVFQQQADLYRVSVQGIWTGVSRSIISIVEISAARRDVYQIAWPEEVMMAHLCQIKDRTVETVATVTSIIGAIDFFRERLHRDGVFMRAFQIDPNYHARVIMTIGALTNFISSIAMFPMYAGVITMQTITCGINDTIVTVQDILIPEYAAENGRIEIGSRKLSEARGAAVGVCLSKSIGSALQELDAEALRERNVATRISDAVAELTELVSRIKFEKWAHIFDGAITYLLGIVHGISDLLQNIDWYHCKPPVSRVLDVGRCVCGDKPMQVIDRRRTGTALTFDFWCSGPLLFTSTLEDDFVVWNPYSLEELLATPGLEYYLACLSTAEDCQRPEDSTAARILQQQGIQIIQVITRCRANYQRKKWDDGALLLGTFPPDAWAFGNLRMETEDNTDFKTLRQQLARKAQLGLIRGIQFDAVPGLWQCLHDAAITAEWNHMCLQKHVLASNGLFSPDAYFAYTPAPSTFYTSTDACQSFTGLVPPFDASSQAAHSKSIWSPGSTNPLPVANFHHRERDDVSSRVAAGQRELETYLTSNILPYLDSLAQNTLNLDSIETAAWTLEGDNLHQLIDCIVLGPYGAADLHSSFRMSDNKPFPVPQYHRGDPTSRAFAPGSTTRGSESRVDIIASAKDMLSQSAKSTVSTEAERVVREIRTMFKDISNLQCRCQDATSGVYASMDCCSQYSSLAAIDFGTRNILDSNWDLADEALATLFQQIVDSNLLSTRLWASKQFTGESTRTFTDDEVFELANAYVFDFEKPVREYGPAEVPLQMRQRTLWHQCTALLSASFFTMPTRNGTVDADTAYDPTATPSEAQANRYMHALELAVEQVLTRARQDAPHFWSHVHRYVPSDSVWCESGAWATKAADRRYDFDAHDASFTSWTVGDATINVEDDTIQRRKVDNLDYVADGSCLCGWYTSDDTACAPRWYGTTAADCWTISNSFNDEWQTLCASGVVSTRDDFFLLLRVLEEGDNEAWMPECEDSMPGVHWGLLDSHNMQHFYSSSASDPFFTDAAAHELSTAGPSGLRIGLLGRLREYASQQQVLRRESSSANFVWKHTVAQPICTSQLHTKLSNDLTQHFPDVFFPMAHSVHDAPASAYCSRYAIEMAILHVLQQLGEGMEAEVAAQQETILPWRHRCHVQLQQLGICELRGVFALRPPDDEYNPPSCPFHYTDTDHGCADLFYVTDKCLVYCDGLFYDPCECGDSYCDTSVFHFTKAGCAGKALPQDARLFARAPAIRLQSMHWPSSIALDESGDDPQQQQLLNQLVQQVDSGHDAIDTFDLLTSLVQAVVNSLDMPVATENTAPAADCSDLADYWGDQQHPVGYHPTTACACQDTRMRGFDAWMSSEPSPQTCRAWQIDPRRLRNRTAYSTTYGHSHLTCDRSVYGTEGVPLNPFYIETRWNADRSVDPMVPLTATQDVLNDMLAFSEPVAEQNSPWRQFDTPLVSPELGHSTGLIRHWYRASGMQSALDAAWPLLPANTQELYGLGPHDNAELTQCAFPGLRTCVTDSDCVLPSLVCLRAPTDDLGRQVGICAGSGTCYAHRHCPDDLLCSGEGSCVAPIIYFQNNLLRSVNLELYSESQCTEDTWGSSLYQNVPSFAHDHGLCNYRSWFHYRNTSATAEPDQELFHLIRDASTRRSDDRKTDTLFERRFMHVDAHACDRTYAHTNFRRCGQDLLALRTYNSDEESVPFRVTRTWHRTADNETATRLCKLLDTTRMPVAGFLNPYEHITDSGRVLDTLAYTKDEIARCSVFGACLAPSFSLEERVGGALTRRVLVLEYDTATGSISPPLGTVRPYSHRDAETCFGFGYVLMIDNEATCVVDRYTSPLIEVVFGDGSTRVPFLSTQNDGNSAVRDIVMRQRFDALLVSCPRAFGADFNAYMEFFYALTVSFLPDEREARLQYANTLLLELFNGPAARGIASLDAYVQDSRCMQHLQTELARVQAMAALPTERPYAFIDANSPPAPGRTVYMFHQRSTIQVSLMWFWKCVVVAGPGEDGGAELDWFVRLTRPGLEGQITCPNFEVTQANRPFLQTIRQKLQTDTYLYDEVDPGRPVLENLLAEIRTTVSVALNHLGLSAWPDLYCMRPANDQVDEDFQCLFPMRGSCWRKFGRDRGAGVTEPDNGNIYQRVENLIMNSVDINIAIQTIESLISVGVLEETIANFDALVEADKTFIPSVRFPGVTQFLQQYPATSHEVRLQEFEHRDYGLFQVQINEAGMLSSPQYAYEDTTNACERYAVPADSVDPSYVLTDNEYSLIATSRLPNAIGNMTLATPDLNARDRIQHIASQTSFTEDEVLYLVLRIFEFEIFNSQTFRVGNLHQVVAFHVQNTPDLQQQLDGARSYNEYMARRTAPCGDDDINAYEETNKQHGRIRDCLPSFQNTAGWEIPGSDVIRVPVPGSFLTAPFYAAFNTRARDLFLDELFDKDQAALQQDFMCAKRDRGVVSLNPYWASEFDFHSGCDIRVLGDFDLGLRAIDSVCMTLSGDQSCADEFPEYYDTLHSPLLMDPHCAVSDGTVHTREVLQKPMCHQAPPVSTEQCGLLHGTLLAQQGESVGSVYGPRSAVDVARGLWAKDSPVFRQAPQPEDNAIHGVALDPHDIGGAYLHFGIQNDKIALMCADLQAAAPTETCARPLGGWIRNIEEFWSLEHNVHDKQWPEPEFPFPHWKCPLKWQEAYSNFSQPFAVRTPDKHRNRVRFSHLTGATPYAHPAVLSTDKVPGLAPSNYFSEWQMCLHSDPALCKNRDNIGTLLAALTVATGQDATAWTAVQRLKTQSATDATCPESLDWPRGVYTLSDHHVASHPLPDAQCNVMDRLPNFAMRYKQRVSARGSPAAVFPGANSRGGACHMGRLPRIPDKTAITPIEFCEPVPGGLRCNGVSLDPEGAPYVWLDEWAVLEPQPQSIPQSTTRRKCSACHDHTPEVLLDAQAAPNTAHAASRKQLSVGLPRAFSPERTLATHIKRLVCGPGDGLCPELAAVGSLSWTQGAFAQSLIEQAPGADTNTTTPVDDADLWSRPWVFCDQSETATVPACNGSIPRSDWIQPTRRVEECVRVSRESATRQYTPIQFCKLTGKTAEICQRIQSWNADILLILCQTIGLEECPETGFFYNPTTYNNNNKEFTADTVQDFYEQVAPSTCPALQSSESYANEALLSQCASIPFQRFRTILEAARGIIRLLIELMYIFVQIVMMLLQAFIALIADAAGSSTNFVYMLRKYFELFIDRIVGIVSLIGDMIFKLIFRDGIGKEIMRFIDACCAFINFLDYVFIKQGWCALLRNVGRIFQAISIISSFFGDARTATDVGKMADWLLTQGTTGICAAEHSPLNCNFEQQFADEFDPVNTVLPVATRCWSTYITFFGDSSPLACTRADTCRLSPLSSTLVKCAQCPAVGPGFDLFGCSPTLKFCACGTPRPVSTRCLSNAACQDAAAQCKYIDTDMGTSTSAVACSACSSPSVCYIEPGADSGICACPLVDMPFGQCMPGEHTQAVWPRQFNSLCFLDHDETDSIAYESSAESMVVAPCTMLSPASSFCFRVTENLRTAGFYVVGMGQISTFGRRLLSFDANHSSPVVHMWGRRLLADTNSSDFDWSSVATHSGVCQDAFAGTAELPNTLRACQQAYTDSAATVAYIALEHNISLPPCALCSLPDFVAAWPRLGNATLSVWAAVVLRHSPLTPLVRSAVSSSLLSLKSVRLLRHDAVHMAVAAYERWLPRQDDPDVRRFFLLPPNVSLPPTRRLLSLEDVVTYFDTLHAKIMDNSLAASYASLVVTSWPSNLPPLSREQASVWQGQWPPQYVVTESECNVAFDILLLAKYAAGNSTLVNNYTLLNYAPLRPPSVLANAWPELRPIDYDRFGISSQAYPSSTVWLTSLVVDAALEALAWLGVSVESLQRFMYSLVTYVEYNLQCDLEAMQTCANWRVNIFMGTIAVGILYVIVFAAGNSFGFTLFPILLLPLYPLFVLQLCYGYQILCFPVLPACLAEDVRLSMQSLFPPIFVVPQTLIKSSAVGCPNPSNLTAGAPRNPFVPARCLLECTEPPFAYSSWEPVLAWLAAEIGLTEPLASLLSSVDFLDLSSLQENLDIKAFVLAQGGDLMWANRICALLHSYRILPYAFGLLASALSLFVVLRYLITIAQSTVMLLGAVAVDAVTPDHS